MHRYFKRWEFKCKCDDPECDSDTVDYELLDVLIKAREKFGPIQIKSGHRCVKHNATKEVGGAPDSMHLEGKAGDVKARNYSPKEVFNYFDSLYPDKYGLGSYVWGTHIDVRPIKARW